MKKLTPKQERFCREYLIDMNGTQAAIRAKYSPKTAQEQASRLLSNVMVIERINKLNEKVEKRIDDKVDTTREEIENEYRKLAFTNSEDLFNWEIEIIETEEGNKRIARPVLKPFEEMTSDQRAAIQSIKPGKDGIEVKLYDKKSALDSLSKFKGMLIDKKEVTAKVEHTISEEAQAILDEVYK